MKLPPPRDPGWQLRALDSASTEVKRMTTGQLELKIEHAPLRGIDREMLLWWFQYFTELSVRVDGQVYPAYQIWHPNDHIKVKAIPDPPLRAGKELFIDEAFQRRSAYRVKERARIHRLDRDGIELRVYKLGRPVMRLRHSFEEDSGGLLYRTRMLLGLEKGVFKPLVNKVIVPLNMNEAKIHAWLKHNVEEVGCFEHFLKKLYDQREKGKELILR